MITSKQEVEENLEFAGIERAICYENVFMADFMDGSRFVIQIKDGILHYSISSEGD
jgi:hypothetical protein